MPSTRQSCALYKQLEHVAKEPRELRRFRFPEIRLGSQQASRMDAMAGAGI